MLASVLLPLQHCDGGKMWSWSLSPATTLGPGPQLGTVQPRGREEAMLAGERSERREREKETLAGGKEGEPEKEREGGMKKQSKK